MNVLRTVFLLTLLTMILVIVGRMVGGRNGMIIALFIGLALNFINYWFSSKIVLATYRARIIEPSERPELFQDVRDLADSAGLPMPKIAIVPNEAPNAFATGRNPTHAVVAVTEGLLRLCDRRQIKAILGHELGHVRNRDMLTMTLVSGAVSAIAMLAHMAQWGAMFGGGGSRDRNGGMLGMILVAIFAPMASMLVQMAISRSREYAADDTGARLSRDPGGLADALERLHAGIAATPPLTTPGSATAHLMIANPLFGHSDLFSTHPSPEKRIARLREMAAKM